MNEKCKKCGMCCRAIRINKSWDEIIAMEAEPIPEELGKSITKYNDAGFIRTFWNPITLEEALEINPHLATWPRYKENFYYRCTKFDAKTNECTINNLKPHVCKEFPWYDSAPKEDENSWHFYSENCGYIEDIPHAVGTCSTCKKENVLLISRSNVCPHCYIINKIEQVKGLNRKNE